MYMCGYVCISSSLNIAMIDHVCMVSKGAERDAGARAPRGRLSPVQLS